MWYPRWETGDGSSGRVLLLTAVARMLWDRSMVSPAGTKDMLQCRSMASRIEDVGCAQYISIPVLDTSIVSEHSTSVLVGTT